MVLVKRAQRWETLQTVKKIFFKTTKPPHAEGHKHFMSQL